MNDPLYHDGDHDDFGGLHRDVPALLGRRDMVRLMGGLSIAGLLAACGVDGATSSATAAPTTAAAAATTTTGATSPTAATTTSASTTSTSPTTLAADLAASAGTEIPDETAGPFPADGSNGPNVLDDGGVVRSDLTTSFGGSSGTAEGIPISIDLSIVDASTGGAIAGAAVYLWHCTADGRYSIYEVADENYLRGVQQADDAGRISFSSVFPGCYAGRWPHAHFEVYESLEAASAGSAAIKISQLALPQSDCETVYADARYGSSLENLGRLSLDTDNVFRDGWSDQLATVAGSMADGYTASLLVRV